MADTRRELGQWGEAQAARYLEARGCQVVVTNWRCTAGEVDLVRVIIDMCVKAFDHGQNESLAALSAANVSCGVSSHRSTLW